MEKGKVIPFPADKRASLPRPNVYILRVYLVSGPYGEESVGHEIFRTLKVRGDQTLEDLHHAIFCSYEREHDRYYEFCLGMDPNDPEGVRYTCGEAVSKYGPRGLVKPGKKVGLAPLATVESLGLTDDQFFGYWFDLIEEWIHLIHVISIEPADVSVDYPLLIEKEGGLPIPVPLDLDRREYGRGEDTLREEDVLVLLMGEMQMRWRKQIENAPLKPNTRLKTALTKLPSHWLEAISRQGDLGEVRNRKGRIDALAEWLPREENLRKIWNSLPLPSREVLSWILLEKSGAVKIQNLSRRYGADTDITWWWNEGQMPETPLGLLRSRGLVYVGKIGPFYETVAPARTFRGLFHPGRTPGGTGFREHGNRSLEGPGVFQSEVFSLGLPLAGRHGGHVRARARANTEKPGGLPPAASPFVPHPHDPGKLGVEPAGGLQAWARRFGPTLRRVRPVGQLPPDPAVGRGRSRAPPGKALLTGCRRSAAHSRIPHIDNFLLFHNNFGVVFR